MGCSNAKLTAIQELQHITNQIKKENLQLEHERDLLKSQHDDRPDEEKESLRDLQVLHNDLEKELKELKDLMNEFLPVPDSKDSTFLSIKNSIERVTAVQMELEHKSEELREMINKRKDLYKEKKNLDNLLTQTEAQIAELQLAVQKKEWTLKERGEFDDSKVKEYERQRSIIIENLKNESLVFNENEGSRSERDHFALLEKNSNESFLALSELEIVKELKEVENELEGIEWQMKNLDLSESDSQQLRNYVTSLRNKLKIAAKNTNFKDQILESEEKIQKLKAEKREKREILQRLKKSSVAVKSDEVYSKIQALNQMLNSKGSYREINVASTVNDSLIFDIEETLRKAKAVTNLKKFVTL